MVSALGFSDTAKRLMMHMVMALNVHQEKQNVHFGREVRFVVRNRKTMTMVEQLSQLFISATRSLAANGEQPGRKSVKSSWDNCSTSDAAIPSVLAVGLTA